MATEDLRIEELLEVDPQFPMLVTTRAYVRPR
jgi:hypothetical protein